MSHLLHAREKTMQIHFRRTWKVGLVALAVLIGGASVAQATLLYDLRVVSANGGATMVDRKHVTVAPGTTGDIVAELWAVVTGGDADVSNDRLGSFAAKFNSVGPVRVNLNRPAQWAAANPQDPASVGVALTHRDPGANNGNLLDWDTDGDMDIGAVSAGPSTTGFAIGRSLAPPAYTGQGSAAEYFLYRFTASADGATLGESMLQVARNVGPNNNTWTQDGVQHTVSTPVGAPGILNIGEGVAITVIPEPGTIALALLGVAGVAIAIRRRKS
jgi:hypothetical protein